MLGLEVLGGFENHAHYDGLFVGKKGASWHLEFTVSKVAPTHTPDKDDLLVFYFATELEYQTKIAFLKNQGITEVEAINPYWNENGFTIVDPDGFRVVLAVRK
tara:strand:+ start:228199 stop:228507 length:309 start_codon:yes stop_codon:yes gene_type:complete